MCLLIPVSFSGLVASILEARQVPLGCFNFHVMTITLSSLSFDHHLATRFRDQTRFWKLL
jgi:hypothetical protein